MCSTAGVAWHRDRKVGGVGELRGFSRVTDNMLRRQEFERQHPDVTITHHLQPWCWVAVWYDSGVRREVTSPELGSLLDVLDAMFG